MKFGGDGIVMEQLIATTKNNVSLVKAESVRCPLFQGETKVATILGNWSECLDFRFFSFLLGETKRCL